MARLYAKALEHHIEADYVRSIIRKRRLPPPASSATESWPWPIKVYTLGRFAILKDDMPLKSTGKLQRKPLELLKALIAAGAEEVNQASLIEALWPEAEGDNAAQAFDTALYRLRKLLGHEAAVVLKDGKLTVDPRYGWVDSRALERLLERADAALQAPASAPSLLEGLAQELFALYGGHFLAEEGAPWALPLRERLRSRFLRTLEQLGRHWEAGAAWEQAVRCYQRGLEAEPLAETLYYRLMCCYQRLGKPAEALAVYRRCRQTLSTLLGISPSPEIEALRCTLDAPRAS
jgi:DNA-binding SARP family transcriptional activator